MTKTTSVPTAEVFMKLWLHECSRVFYDRLINEEDRELFEEEAYRLVKDRFKQNHQKEDLFGKKSIIFSMLMKLDSDERPYEEIVDKVKL